MDIKRDLYLNRLISFMWDGQVKVITGIRRCGKSYLLRTIFKRYLLEQGVAEDHILSYELDLAKDIQYRNDLDILDQYNAEGAGRGAAGSLVSLCGRDPDVRRGAEPLQPRGKEDHLLRCAQRPEIARQSGHLCDRQQFPYALQRYPH